MVKPPRSHLGGDAYVLVHPKGGPVTAICSGGMGPPILRVWAVMNLGSLGSVTGAATWRCASAVVTCVSNTVPHNTAVRTAARMTPLFF